MSFSESKTRICEGDTVILYVSIRQVYAIQVKGRVTNKHGQEVDNVFQTKYGSLRVTELIGARFGSRVQLSKGWAHVLYPTPELWTLTLPHRTQILYTPDISMVITQLEVGPGSVVCEAGTGSGSLSHAFLRAVGPTGKLHTCDFHKERVQMAEDEFRRHGFGGRVTVSHRDVCLAGLGVEGAADAVFLDLPKPWEALPHAVRAIKLQGGRVCSFSPCIEQISRTCELMAALGLQDVTTLECLAREFQVKSITLPALTKKHESASQDQTSATKKFKVDQDQSKTNEHTEDQADHQTKTNDDTDDQTKGNDDPDDVVDARQEGGGVGGRGSGRGEEVKFRTGITLLKMPGHTGFLTFATVPPGLPRPTLGHPRGD